MKALPVTEVGRWLVGPQYYIVLFATLGT